MSSSPDKKTSSPSLSLSLEHKREKGLSAEMNKQAFFTILVLLACCVALMPGMPTSRGRCSCRTWRNYVNEKRIVTEKSVYHEPSGLCSQEELIVTLRDNRRVCLNLNKDQGRRIKEGLLNKNKTK
ncbi:C-X-C motif chemokine 2-like [Thamnophis elegans]|uniref:C-X-C motif chemokine 2-like n=1 Tax=Thamnophis elegans TaxID=35005 RepID=UPI00137780CD|nr:C-X-C motif chemokine 2-like [Thamnophis elegans]